MQTTQSRDQYTDTEDLVNRLSFANKQEIDAIQILRNEIFSQSESKVKSIFNLETALRNEIRDKNLALKRVVDLKVKQDKSCSQLKDKKSEISTLKTQVEMLLSQKNTIIFEYITVLDNQYSSLMLMTQIKNVTST